MWWSRWVCEMICERLQSWCEHKADRLSLGSIRLLSTPSRYLGFYASKQTESIKLKKWSTTTLSPPAKYCVGLLWSFRPVEAWTPRVLWRWAVVSGTQSCKLQSEASTDRTCVSNTSHSCSIGSRSGEFGGQVNTLNSLRSLNPSWWFIRPGHLLPLVCGPVLVVIIEQKGSTPVSSCYEARMLTAALPCCSFWQWTLGAFDPVTCRPSLNHVCSVLMVPWSWSVLNRNLWEYELGPDSSCLCAPNC